MATVKGTTAIPLEEQTKDRGMARAIQIEREGIKYIGIETGASNKGGNNSREYN